MILISLLINALKWKLCWETTIVDPTACRSRCQPLPTLWLLPFSDSTWFIVCFHLPSTWPQNHCQRSFFPISLPTNYLPPNLAQMLSWGSSSHDIISWRQHRTQAHNHLSYSTHIPAFICLEARSHISWRSSNNGLIFAPVRDEQSVPIWVPHGTVSECETRTLTDPHGVTSAAHWLSKLCPKVGFLPPAA